MTMHALTGLSPVQRQRLTPAQREVFELISERGAISYTDIAAELYIDRDTAIVAVRQLENERLIVKTPGRGRVPNRYSMCEVAQ